LTMLVPECAKETEALPVKPFIRWAGGKTRLRPRVIPHIPESFNNYHEPFLGSGAIFLAIDGRINGRAYLADLNGHLANAWLAVRDHQGALKTCLAEYKSLDSKEYYYEVRAQVPSDPIEQAARFLYLNGTSWNHLWRENSKTGAMNVPWGNRQFKEFDADTWRTLKARLRVADVRQEDFRVALTRVEAGDFVYLDPPYLPVWSDPNEKEPTSKFNKYTARVFEQKDLEELARRCEDFTRRGIRWVMSNRDTPNVRRLFPFADVVTFTTHRSLAAQSKRAVEARCSPEAIIIGR